MNIEYLREFIEIGLCLNLSKAARTLHISQPSLSKHVAALEKECQTPLLNRSASRIQLTAAGQALFEEAFDLIRRHDQTVERIRAYKNVNQLRIGGLYDSNRIIGMMNKALTVVNAEGTVVSISYQNHRHESLIELVDGNKIDLAVTMLSDSDTLAPNYEKIFLMRDPMVCVMGKSHPLAQCEQLHITDLDGQIIWQPVGSHSTEFGRTTVRDIFSRYHVHPIQKPVFVHSITELTTVPHEGGLFIMEKSMLDTQPCIENLCVLPLFEKDVAFYFYALWRTDQPNGTRDAFVNALASLGES